MHDVSSTIERDIHRLKTGIRQLKVQYDMFFAGSLPREPFELRSQLEKLIKRNSNATIRKYAHRYHFNSLVSQFNTMVELWGKTIRTREEGERRAHGLSNRQAMLEENMVTYMIKNPLAEENALRKLHARFLEARRKAHKKNGKLTFDSFLKGIAAQGEKLRQKSGCTEIEVRLVVNDENVQVKARPKKS